MSKLLLILVCIQGLVAQAVTTEKRVMNYDLAVRTLNPKGARVTFFGLMRKYRGYITYLSDNEVSIAVPQANSETLVKEFEGSVQVSGKTINAEDLTERHVIATEELKNSKVQIQKYLLLLKQVKAEQLNQVQNGLERAIGTLEVHATELTSLNERLSFDRVRLVSTVSHSNASIAVRKDAENPFAWMDTLSVEDLMEQNTCYRLDGSSSLAQEIETGEGEGSVEEEVEIVD